MKRGRKPAVPYNKRHDWLKRNRSGESPPVIAKSDGYDQRTVRNNLNLARREEEAGEARTAVYREALQSHYADLYGLAARLAKTVESENRVDEIKNERLCRALRQHLPASKIWPSFEKWDVLLENREKGKKLLENRIGKEIVIIEKAGNMLIERKGFTEGMTKALSFQASQFMRARQGLDANRDIHLEPVDSNNTVGKYGAYIMGQITEEELPVLRKTVEQLELSIINWEEYIFLQETESHLRKLKENLLDDLAVITLRRVVPGSCRYCPD
jgi:hypothetical protein